MKKRGTLEISLVLVLFFLLLFVAFPDAFTGYAVSPLREASGQPAGVAVPEVERLPLVEERREGILPPSETPLPRPSDQPSPTPQPLPAPSFFPEPIPLPCFLTEAFWSATQVAENDVVTLTVRGTSSCAGREVGFIIIEQDPLFNDIGPTLLATFTPEGRATTSWEAVSDLTEQDKKSEYVFTVRLPSPGLSSVTGSAVYSNAQRVIGDVFGAGSGDILEALFNPLQQPPPTPPTPSAPPTTTSSGASSLTSPTLIVTGPRIGAAHTGAFTELTTYLEAQLQGLPSRYLVPVTSDHHIDFLFIGNNRAEVDTEFDRFVTLQQVSGVPLGFVAELGDKGGWCGAGINSQCTQGPLNNNPQNQIDQYGLIKNDPARWVTAPVWMTVMGSHEIDSSVVGKSNWIDMLYPTLTHSLSYPGNDEALYYKAEVGNFIFFVLDQNKQGTGGFFGIVPQEQLDFIDTELNKPANANKYAFIFMHEPIVKRQQCGLQNSPLQFLTNTNGEAQRALDMFAKHPQIQAIFAGHITGCSEEFKLQNKLFVITDTNGQRNYFLDLDEQDPRKPWRLKTIDNSNTIKPITNVESYGSWPNQLAPSVFPGKGCTTAFFIDKDCDGYGVAKQSDDVYDPYETEYSDMPDADDNDPTLNTPQTAMNKYNNFATRADFVQYLVDRGYAHQIGNIYFIASNGDDNTGQPNNINRPFATLRHLVQQFQAGNLAPNDVIVYRQGIYEGAAAIHTTFLSFPTLGGLPGQPFIIMAFPGEQAVINGNDPAIATVDAENLVLDGFIVTCMPTAQTTCGSSSLGAKGYWIEGSKNLAVKNTEVLHMKWGAWGGKKKVNVIIEDSVFRDNAPEHGIYFPSASGEDHENILIKNNLIYRNHRFGFQHNGLARNTTLESNIIHSNALGGITFTNGVISSTVVNNIIYNNNKQGMVIWNDNQLVPKRSADNNKIINNHFWIGTGWNGVCEDDFDPVKCTRFSTPGSFSAIEIKDSTGLYTFTNSLFRNNIFAIHGGPAFKTDELKHIGASVIDYNIFYRRDGNTLNGLMSGDTDGSHNQLSGGNYFWTLNTLQSTSPWNAVFQSNLAANPLFVDPSLSYALTPELYNLDLIFPASPALDFGTSTGMPPDDLRGLLRVVPPDAGAYEYASASTAPRLDSLVPNLIFDDQNYIVVANGANFIQGPPGSKVLIDGTEWLQAGNPSYAVITTNQIDIDILANSLTVGFHTVLIENPNGEKSVQRTLQVQAGGGVTTPPVTNSLTPSTVPDNTNTLVLVDGGNFASNAELLFAGGVYPAQYVTVLPPNQLYFIALAGTPVGQYTIEVRNPGSGLKSQPLTLTVVPGTVQPTITSLSPASVPSTQNAAFTILGSSFDPAVQVFIANLHWVLGGNPLYLYQSPTQILVGVPAGVPAGQYPVYVENPGPLQSNTETLTVTACAAGEQRLCPQQQGVCAGSMETCDANGNWPGCGQTEYQANAQANFGVNYENGAETLCDGEDNNCDGQVDNIPQANVPLCQNQLGACAGTKQTCGGTAGWQSCPLRPAEQGAQCADGLDNDCDGEADYDGFTGGLITPAIHGDAGCPVGVTSIRAPLPPICPGTTATVDCDATVGNVRSISADVDGQACQFASWQGTTASFSCTLPVLPATLTLTCDVDATKSYQTGTAQSTQLTTGGTTCCSQYTTQNACEGSGICEWCTSCQGGGLVLPAKSSGGSSRCVSVGNCNYACIKGQCGAECDPTAGGCAATETCNLNDCTCAAQPPVTTSLTPSTVFNDVTTTVVVDGSNFASAAELLFAGAVYPSTFLSSTQMSFDVLQGTAPGQYTVEVRNQPSGLTSTPPLVLNVQQGGISAPPSITQVTPSQVAVNVQTQVTVDGTNFGPAAEVHIDGQPLAQSAYVSQSPTQIIWIYTPNALTVGQHNLVVHNPLLSLTSNPEPFTVTSALPQTSSTLSNQYLSLTITNKGQQTYIDNMTDEQTGFAYDTHDVDLLQFSLRATSGAVLNFTLADLPHIFTATPGQTNSLQLLWQNIQVDAQNSMDVTATITLPPNSLTADFSITAKTSMPDYALYTLTFPYVSFRALSQTETEALLIPTQMGRLVLDPRTNLQLYSPGVFNSQSRTLQLFAYYTLNTEHLAYFAVKDRDAYYKTQNYNVTSDAVSFSVTHYPENHLTPNIDYTAPYAVALGAFQGDWYDAAQLYRQWAIPTMVTRGKLATASGISSFFHALDIYSTFTIGDTLQQKQQALAIKQDIDGFKSFFNRCPDPSLPSYICDQNYRVDNFLVELYGWHANTIGSQRYNWPADYKPIDPAVFELVKQLRKDNHVVIPYTIEIDFDHISPSFATQPVIQNSVVDAQGNLLTRPGTVNNLWSFPNPSTQWWRDFTINNIVLDHTDFGDDDPRYAGVGFDGVYWDVLSGMAPLPDYATRSSHPQGGGNYWVQGEIARLQASRQAASKVNPRWLMASEFATEAYLNELDFAQWNVPPQIQDPHYNVPLFPAVYHDYLAYSTIIATISNMVQNFGPPIVDYMSYVWALHFSHGTFASVSNSIASGPVFPLPAPDQPFYLFLKQLYRSYAYAKDYLVYGQLLQPLELQVANSPQSQLFPGITPNIFYKNHYPNIPHVLSSVWRAPTGDVGIVLINWHDNNEPVTFTFAFADYGLQQGTLYYLSQLDEVSPTLLATHTSTFTHSLTIPGKSIVVLQLSTDNPTLDNDKDFVPDRIDLCPNTQAQHKYLVGRQHGCPLPLATMFSQSLTTSFRSLPTLRNVQEPAIGVEGVGVIRYPGQQLDLMTLVNNRYEPLDLDSYLNISMNNITLDAANLPSLNTAAELTLYNLPYLDPVLYKDDTLCTDCVLRSYNTQTGELTVAVPDFSSYTAGEGSCGDGTCSLGESCTTCSQDCGPCPGSGPSPSGSGRSGGRGGSAGGLAQTINLDVADQYTVELTRVGVLYIIYNTQQSSMRLTRLDSASATLSFSIQQYLLPSVVGQIYGVDLDTDGRDDVLVSLDAIRGATTATLSFARIQPELQPPIGKPIVQELGVQAEGPSLDAPVAKPPGTTTVFSLLGWRVLLIAFIIGLALVLRFVVLQRRQ